MKNLFSDWLVLNGTEIDECFLAGKFKVEGYEFRTRRYQNERVEKLLKFVRRSLTCKRSSYYEPKCSECIGFGLFCY